MRLSKFMIVSPCISICKNDPITGFCRGCARNDHEKKLWKAKNTSEEWKLINLLEIKSRMKVKELKYFKKSYKYKCKYGISLEKKRKLKLHD